MDVNSAWTIDATTSPPPQTLRLPLYETTELTPSPPPSPSDVSSSTTIAPAVPQGSHVNFRNRGSPPLLPNKWYTPQHSGKPQEVDRPSLQLSAQTPPPAHVPTTLPDLARESSKRYIPDIPQPRAGDDRPRKPTPHHPVYTSMPPGLPHYGGYPRPVNRIAPQFLASFHAMDESWQMTDELMAEIERADNAQLRSQQPPAPGTAGVASHQSPTASHPRISPPPTSRKSVNSSWTIDATTSSALPTPRLPLYETTEPASSPSPPPSSGDVSSSTTIVPAEGSDVDDSHERPPPPHLEGEYIVHESRKWYTPQHSREPHPRVDDQPPQPSAQAPVPAHVPTTPPDIARESNKRYIPDTPQPRAKHDQPPKSILHQNPVHVPVLPGPDMPQPRADDQAPNPGAQGQDRVYVPMPPGPTVVQLPLFETLMEILREHRLAQLATVDQQRELMKYMSSLNYWLVRDVQDRQAELWGLAARVNQLRADLGRLAVGVAQVQPTARPQAVGEGAGGPVFSPPGAGTPMIRIERSPQRHSPTLLETPGWHSPHLSRSNPPSDISFLTIMHTLAVITAIALALVAFFRAQPMQVRCQYELSSAVESLTSITGSLHSHGIAEAASSYVDGSSISVQEGLSDASVDVVAPIGGSRPPVNASRTSTTNTAPVITALVSVVGGTLLGVWLTCQSNKRYS